MAALRAVLLLFLCRLPLASSCIPTVTPDDMYEDEMEATTSVLLTTVLDMTAETTSQATTTTTTTAGMCPPSWVLNPANNFCYLLVPQSAGTVDNTRCDAQVAGATLASIHNADENDFLANILDDATTNYAFLGGYSPTPGMLGTWYWTDGTMYGPYENWIDNFPVAGLNCMVMTTTSGQFGRWYNIPCTSQFDLFCMIAAT